MVQRTSFLFGSPELVTVHDREVAALLHSSSLFPSEDDLSSTAYKPNTSFSTSIKFIPEGKGEPIVLRKMTLKSSLSNLSKQSKV